jgi:hypothetical protein
MTLQELLDKIIAHHEQIESEIKYDLDEMIIDLKSYEASEINNNGIACQCEYLIESGNTPEEIDLFLFYDPESWE